MKRDLEYINTEGKHTVIMPHLQKQQLHTACSSKEDAMKRDLSITHRGPFTPRSKEEKRHMRVLLIHIKANKLETQK